MPREVWHSEDGKWTFILDPKGCIDIVPRPPKSVFNTILQEFEKDFYKGDRKDYIEWSL